MAVLIEAVCAVVRRDAIQERIPEGWAAFSAAVPTVAFSYDDELASVGFMVVADAEAFLSHLKALGLRVNLESGDGDVCLVEQLGRVGAPAAWLSTTRIHTEELGGEVTIAFLKGTRERRIVTPSEWKFQGSASQTPFEFARDGESRLRLLRSQDNVDVYWDEQQRREVYVGRPYGAESNGQQHVTDAQRGEHIRLWNKARAIADKHKLYFRVPPFKPSPLVAREMSTAMELLDRAIKLYPNNAAALWLQGKILQLHGDLDASMDRLATACLMEPMNAIFSREAGITATEAGKLDVAVFYTQEALKATPGDAGLRTNLALAHVFAGNLAAAQKEIDAAHLAEPDDPITRSVWFLVREVASGRMQRPTKVSEIDAKAVYEAASAP